MLINLPSAKIKHLACTLLAAEGSRHAYSAFAVQLSTVVVKLWLSHKVLKLLHVKYNAKFSISKKFRVKRQRWESRKQTKQTLTSKSFRVQRQVWVYANLSKF